MKKVLKLMSVEGQKVTNLAAMEMGMLRYVGYSYDDKEGDFVKNDEVCEVAFDNYYVKCLKKGLLLPADKFSAEVAGLAWDGDK